MKPKKQRLLLAVLAVAAIIGAGLLATMALKKEASYFYTPAEAQAAHIPAGQAARLGGMVEAGSLRHEADGVTIAFRLTDGTATVPVRYTGIVPDLFAEGAGAVADGRFNADGSFVADTILAKHDEKYVPPQMSEAMKNATASPTATPGAVSPSTVAEGRP